MKKIYSNSGQATVTLLFFMIIAITITSAAIVLMVNISAATSSFQQGSSVSFIAESGIENAIIRLLRDPLYSGETMDVGDGTAVITVTGINPKTIISKGRLGNFLRAIQVQASYTDNTLSIISWKEILI